MVASLIVAGYELLGGTTNPEYRLAPGFDFGDGEPDQTTIASLYLDGDTVSGERTRNRTFDLPVNVLGAGPVDLAGKVDTLLAAVSAATFTVQWTPDGGLPVLFDCYRATWSRPRSLVHDAAGQTGVRLTFQASPFGRSTAVQSISAATSLQLDSYDTAPTGATLDTTSFTEGTGSARVGTTKITTATVSRSLATLNLSTFSNVRLFHGIFTSGGHGSLSATLTAKLRLTSASGSTDYTATTTVSAFSLWQIVNVPLTGGVVATGSGVTLTAVTSYTLTLTYVWGTQTGSFSIATVNIDDLRATGSSSALTTTTHAGVLSLPAVNGSARAPANLALTNGSTFTAFLLHRPPRSQSDTAQILTSLTTSLATQTATIPAVGADFAGTYGLALGVGTLGGGAVTVTVTITQYANGVAVGSTTVLTKAYTSGVSIIPVGAVTLPLYGTPADNTLTSYDFVVAVTGADRYSEMMLLDSRGQTVYTDSNLTTAIAAAYIDEPVPLQSGSAVYGSAAGRAAAYSLLGSCWMTGGPVLLEPGAGKLLAWVSTSGPIVTATYSERWIDERPR